VESVVNVSKLFLRNRFSGLLLLGLAGILLVAACDDDDDDDGGDGGQLKIGYLADFSGPLAEFGPEIQTGVELAIAHINAAGGVNGEDVIFVTGDTRVDPTVAVEEARRLIEIEGVAAIVGPLGSTETLAAVESVIGPAGVVAITPSATSPGIALANDNDFLFRATISDAAQGVILAQLAADEGLDNVAVIYRNDAYGQGLNDAFDASFEGTSTSVSYEPGATSYLAELQQLDEGGADYLVAIGFPEEGIIFLREALENDLFSQFLFVDGTKSQDLIDAIGDPLNGFKGTAAGSAPEPEPSTLAWNAAYEAEYGALPTRPYVREAYDATIAIALAAERAGSVDPTEIRDALREIASPPGDTYIAGAEGVAAALEAVRDGDDINYDGAATTMDWNDVGDVTSGYIEIWQYEGGQIVSVEMVPFSLE
jgi:ABC-type branched-subunit amino acid transport system substrate-binding protein